MSSDDLRKKPEETQWYPLYQYFYDKPYGFMATYEELTSVVGVDLRMSSRWTVYRTKKHLLETAQRCIDCVDGVGYRVVEPKEHLSVAKDHRLRGKRQIEKAVTVLEGTPRDKLSMQELQQHASAELVMSRQMQLMRKRSIRGLTKEQKKMATDTVVTNSEIVQSRLSQFGITNHSASAD